MSIKNNKINMHSQLSKQIAATADAVLVGSMLVYDRTNKISDDYACDLREK